MSEALAPSKKTAHWFDPIRSAISVGTSNVFIISGNVRDRVENNDESSVADYVQQQVLRMVSKNGKESSKVTVPIYITQTGGMVFKTKADLHKVNSSLRDVYSRDIQTGLASTGPSSDVTPYELSGVTQRMSIIESSTCLQRLFRGPLDNIAVVIDHAQLVVPNPSLGLNCSSGILEVIRQAATNNTFTRINRIKDGQGVSARRASWIFLITDDEQDLHPEVKNCPGLVKTRVPLPNNEERQTVINYTIEAVQNRVPTWNCDTKNNLHSIASAASGLLRDDIEGFVWESVVERKTFDANYMADKKVGRIQDRYGSVLIPVKSNMTFDQIGGHDHVKRYFMRFKNLVAQGDMDMLPSGVLLSGPSGTGKTALMQAVAKELGFQMVLLDPSSVLSSYVGSSERNLRSALDCAEAMAPVLIFIDELDAAFTRGAKGDSGVSERLFGAILKFISPESTSKGILFVGATNHPENVDAALTRPGRMGDIIPMLPPNTAEGRWAIVKAVTKQLQFSLEIDEATGIEICSTQLDGIDRQLYTGSELRNVVRNPVVNKSLETGKVVRVLTPELLRYGFEVVKPSTREVEAWTHTALNLASSKEFIPDDWQDSVVEKAPVEFISQKHGGLLPDD